MSRLSTNGLRNDRTGSRLRLAFLGALVAGGGARLALAFGRPLWADEIFTLELARRPLPALLSALRLDSGPPLHYLAAKLLLLPFPAAGPADAVVRLLSVAASLLHVPLLLRIGRRAGAPKAGLVAASLFLVLPLASISAAEGRGYALASLLALASFERLLALDGAPLPRTAVVAGLLGGAAFLTHYLALLPVAGALLASLARGRARRPVFLAAAVAAASAVSWLPVALAQPRASMAWAEARPAGERALAFAANLGLGLPAGLGPALLLGPLGLLVLGAALATRGTARVPAAAPLAAGLALLAPLLLYSRSALLPDRTALLFLPLVALLLAEARPVLAAAAGSAGAVALAASFPAELRSSPSAELAATLLPEARRGARVVAAELWGPELDYRLSRAGLPGRVVRFPSDVSLHPGWYAEEEVPEERARAEAAAVVAARTGRTFFVFSPATRAGRALLAEMPPAGALRVASAGLFEIWLAAAGPDGGGGQSGAAR